MIQLVYVLKKDLLHGFSSFSGVGSDSYFYQKAQREDIFNDIIESNFGLKTSVFDQNVILKEIYPSYISNLKKKSFNELKDNLFDIIGLSIVDTDRKNNLKQIISDFENKGIMYSVMVPKVKQSYLLNVSGTRIQSDTEIYRNYISKLVSDLEIEQVVSFERDMDCLASGLSIDSRIPSVERVILTRDSFGGKNSDAYLAMRDVLFNSKKELIDDFTFSDVDMFKSYVSRNMSSVIEKDKNFMSYVWARDIEPFIQANKNTLFLDVGWKGGMQYFSGELYEQKNKKSETYTSLIYTKKGLEPDAFRGLTRTPDEFFSEEHLFDFF